MIGLILVLGVYQTCFAQNNNVWLPLVSSIDPASIPTPVVVAPTPVPQREWWEIPGVECRGCFLFGDWSIWSAPVDCDSPQPMYLRFQGNYYNLDWEPIDRTPAVQRWQPENKCYYTVSMKWGWGSTTEGASDPTLYIFTGHN